MHANRNHKGYTASKQRLRPCGFVAAFLQRLQKYKSSTKMIFAPPPDMGGHKIFAPLDRVDTTFSYLSDTPLHDIFSGLGGV